MNGKGVRSGYHGAMTVIHIPESDAALDFAGLMGRVREGSEIVIENGSSAVAVLHAPGPLRRTIEQCIALLPEDSPTTIDEDFASDVAAARHREPLNAPLWD